MIDSECTITSSLRKTASNQCSTRGKQEYARLPTAVQVADKAISKSGFVRDQRSRLLI
jgi:hypothetical protein